MFFGGIFLLFAVRDYKKRSAVAFNDPLIHESTEYTT